MKNICTYIERSCVENIVKRHIRDKTTDPKCIIAAIRQGRSIKESLDCFPCLDVEVIILVTWQSLQVLWPTIYAVLQKGVLSQGFLMSAVSVTFGEFGIHEVADAGPGKELTGRCS